MVAYSTTVQGLIATLHARAARLHECYSKQVSGETLVDDPDAPPQLCMEMYELEVGLQSGNWCLRKAAVLKRRCSK